MDILLGQRMRELRSHRKNTQEQLAVHLGITTQAVSKWERGEGFPDIAMLPAIAAFYIVNRQEFYSTNNFESLVIARQKEMAESCFDFVRTEPQFEEILDKVMSASS